YYRMVAVFAPGERKDLPLAPAAIVQNYDAAVKQVDVHVEKLNLNIKALLKQERERLLEIKYKALPEDVQLALKTEPAKRTEAQKLQAEQVTYSVGVADSEILPKL